MKCLYCGKEFVGMKHANGIEKKYCSVKCKSYNNMLNTFKKKKEINSIKG